MRKQTALNNETIYRLNTTVLREKTKAGTKNALMLVIKGTEFDRLWRKTDFFIYSKFKSPFFSAWAERDYFVLPSFGFEYYINRENLKVYKMYKEGILSPADDVTAYVRNATEEEKKVALGKRSYVPLFWKVKEINKKQTVKAV